MYIFNFSLILHRDWPFSAIEISVILHRDYLKLCTDFAQGLAFSSTKNLRKSSGEFPQTTASHKSVITKAAAQTMLKKCEQALACLTGAI